MSERIQFVVYQNLNKGSRASWYFVRRATGGSNKIYRVHNLGPDEITIQQEGGSNQFTLLPGETFDYECTPVSHSVTIKPQDGNARAAAGWIEQVG